MKIGPRKPSIKKSIKARTTGRAKRQIKKAVIPGYGKKGTGWIKDPKKAAYNKVYNKTTYGVNPLSNTSGARKNNYISTNFDNNALDRKEIIKPTLIEILLTIFLGWLGFHKFYTKHYLLGVYYFCSCGGFFIGWFVDIIRLFIRIYRFYFKKK